MDLQFAAWILLVIGVCGSLASTILFPLLSLLLNPRRRALAQGPVVNLPIRSLDVLIAAHNEETVIAGTLRSIRAARDRYGADRSSSEGKGRMSVRIIVGVDASSDQTESLARSAADDVLVFPENKSKWKTLMGLLQASDADWVVFVDAGTLWPENFLLRFSRSVAEADVIGFAPSYGVKGSRLSRLVWRFERGIKSLEGLSGGPVSVHGATVAYRRSSLDQVLSALDGVDWCNDDVVLPLCLRARFPEARIVYSTHPDVLLNDLGIGSERKGAGRAFAGDLPRRLRLVFGNVQWMKSLLKRVFAQNAQVGLLALRRLFRVFWAWWASLVLLALVLASVAGAGERGTEGAASVSVLLGICVWVFLFGSLRGAFTASLLAPFLFIHDNGRSVRWK